MLIPEYLVQDRLLELIASFPWYPFEWLQPHYDLLWSHVRVALDSKGIRAPKKLSDSKDYRAQWASPHLLLSQCCGYNIAAKTQDLTVVAVPHFDLDGIAPGQYRSIVVARTSDGYRRIEDFKGKRAAFNEHQSFSGHTALLSAIPKKLRRPNFFADMVPSGSHLHSIQALVEDRADVAAIDEVSWLLIGDQYPKLVGQLSKITDTKCAQAPPYVTASDQADAIGDALVSVSRTDAVKESLKAMRIRAIVDATNECYRPLEKTIKEIEAAAGVWARTQSSQPRPPVEDL